MSDLINTLHNLYGDIINYEDFCNIIKQFGDVNYTPQLDLLTHYVPIWKIKNNFADVSTTTTVAFSIHNNKSDNKLTVLVTFSTVEKFMPREWRLLSAEQRQEIRLSTFNKAFGNYDSFNYSEGTTLMGQCKWLISYKYSITISNIKEFTFEDIKPLLERMKVLENKL